MVSLTRSFNTNSGGATFFSESLNMGERELLQPILDSYGVFKPLKTIPIFSFHLLFVCALDVAAIIYAIIHPDQKSKCKEYFLMLYLHIALWFFTLVLDQMVKYKHHSLRLNGYFEFYRNTQLHISLPLYIVSLWSVVLMLIQTLMQHFYIDDFAEKCVNGGPLSPFSYISAVLTLEVCAIAGININYIMKVRKFNIQKSPPDVQKEEWITCANPENLNPNEIGYKQLGEKVVDLLEKQADLIRHLKEHNARLGEKLMLVTSQYQQARSQQRREPRRSSQPSRRQLPASQVQQPPQEQLRQNEDMLQRSQDKLNQSAEHSQPAQDVIPAVRSDIVEVHPVPFEERDQRM